MASDYVSVEFTRHQHDTKRILGPSGTSASAHLAGGYGFRPLYLLSHQVLDPFMREA